MDNLRVLRQVYDDCDAERAMHYDKLNRVLNNVGLTHDPVSTARKLVENIAHLEHTQEVTVRFMNEIHEEIAKAQAENEKGENQEPASSEDENQE